MPQDAGAMKRRTHSTGKAYRFDDTIGSNDARRRRAAGKRFRGECCRICRQPPMMAADGDFAALPPCAGFPAANKDDFKELACFK